MGGSYSHSKNRVNRYGYGGVFLKESIYTASGLDANIVITGGSQTIYISEIIVFPSALSKEDVRAISATMDDEYQTQNYSHYVDTINGSDSNNGLTEFLPKLTLPVWGMRDFLCFGAGDCFYFRAGQTLANVSLNFRPVWGFFSYSSDHPTMVSAYGPLADGPFVFEGRTTNVGIDSHQSDPFFLIARLSARNERRNPLNGTYYAGYETVRLDSTQGVKLSADLINTSARMGDLRIDPVIKQALQCEALYHSSAAMLDAGSDGYETWTGFINGIFGKNWKESLALVSAAGGPAGIYTARSAMLLIDGNVSDRPGWWEEPASIPPNGAHLNGNRVFSDPIVATYSTTTDRTTITRDNLFINVLMGVNSRGWGIVKRISDPTEIEVEIFSKISNSTLLLRGNPLGLDNNASHTDVLMWGGLPGAPDGRHHFVYNQSNQGGGHLTIDNIVNEAADHFVQHRSGGWISNNITLDPAIGGFSADKSTCIFEDNLLEGGKRTHGSNFSGERCWGFSVFDNNPQGAMRVGRFRNNIMNQHPGGFSAGVIQNQFGNGTFAFSAGGGPAIPEIVIENNTVCRILGAAIKRNGVSNTITSVRNIVNSYNEGHGTPRFNSSNMVIEGVENSQNVYYDPDGPTINMFDGGTKNFAQWESFPQTNNELFDNTVFSSPIPLYLVAEYYGTLEGGSVDKQAWIDACLIARRAGNMGALSASTTLAWARNRVRPSNRTLAEGGGIVPGVSSIPSGPIALPTITTPTQTGITDDSAVLGANITDDGDSDITQRGIVISVTGTNSDPLIGGEEVTTVVSSGKNGVFTVNVTGLTPSTNYSWAAFATNSEGTTYTTVGTFTTLLFNAPTVTTTTQTSITATAAVLGANVTTDGNSAITLRGIVISVTGINNNPLDGATGVTTITTAGTTGVFTINVTGLTPSTNYSWKAFATNSEGTTYTAVRTFTTIGTPFLEVTDVFAVSITGTITVNTSRLTTPPLTRLVRLYARNGNFDCDNLAIQEGGISTIVSYTQSNGITPIPQIDLYVIPEDDYVIVTIAINRLTVGENQTGAIEFSDQQSGFATATVNFSVNVRQPIVITKVSGAAFGTPELVSTNFTVDLNDTIRITAGPSDISSLSFVPSGILGISGSYPTEISGGDIIDVAVVLDASNIGTGQSGGFNVTAAGGVSTAVSYGLNVQSVAALRLTTSTGTALLDPVTFNRVVGSIPTDYSVRLYSDFGSFDCSNLSVTTSGIVLGIDYAQSNNEKITVLSDFTLAAGDYLNANITLDGSTVGLLQQGSVLFDGSFAGAEEVNFSMNVAAALQLRFTDSSGINITNPIGVATTQNIAPLPFQIRLYADNGVFDVSDLTSEVFGSVNLVGYSQPNGVVIPDINEYLIAQNSYVNVNLNLLRAAVGDNRTGSIRLFTPGGAFDITANFSIDVAAAPIVNIIFKDSQGEVLDPTEMRSTVQLVDILETITVENTGNATATDITTEFSGILSLNGSPPSQTLQAGASFGIGVRLSANTVSQSSLGSMILSYSGKSSSQAYNLGVQNALSLRLTNSSGGSIAPNPIELSTVTNSTDLEYSVRLYADNQNFNGADLVVTEVGIASILGYAQPNFAQQAPDPIAPVGGGVGEVDEVGGGESGLTPPSGNNNQQNSNPPSGNNNQQNSNPPPNPIQQVTVQPTLVQISSTPIPNINSHTILAGSYIIVNIAIDRSISGDGQTGSVQLSNGTQNLLMSFDVDASPSAAAVIIFQNELDFTELQPIESRTTPQFINIQETIIIKNDGNLTATGLSLAFSGVVLSVPDQQIPSTLAPGATFTYGIILDANQLGTNLPGSVTVSFNGSEASTQQYLLTVFDDTPEPPPVPPAVGRSRINRYSVRSRKIVPGPISGVRIASGFR